MRVVFADTSYWVALLHRRDRLHSRAARWIESLKDARILTTDAVLVEVLNYYASHGPEMRDTVSRFVRRLWADPNVEVVHWERTRLISALDLYEHRRDKEYSAVDCMSMLLMRERGIQEALTHDRHFEQEGFVALLRQM